MISQKKSLPTKPDEIHCLARWPGRKACPQAALSEEADRQQKPGEIERPQDQLHAQTKPEQSVEQALDRLALRTLFRQADCSTLDGLNEYDEDDTFFSPRGDILTQDMQRGSVSASLAANGAVAGDALEWLAANRPVVEPGLPTDSAATASQPDQSYEQV